MSDWQKQVVCRYFVLGSCKKGEGCAYSHDPDLIPQSTGFAQVPGFVDAYYQDYVGDDTVHFGDGFSQTASDYGGPDFTLDSAEGFVSEIYPVEYVGAEGGESGEGGDEEPSINPEDPGGGVNDEHSANSCYDNTPCHIQGLSVGVNSLSLDPCSDPNCLQDNPQDYCPVSTVYPTSPTYIVYTPMYQSPALSPANIPPLLSPPAPISIVTTTPTSAVLSPSGGIMQTAILSPTGLGPALMQVHHPALSPHHPLHIHSNHQQPHQQPNIEPTNIQQQEQDNVDVEVTKQTTATEESNSKQNTVSTSETESHLESDAPQDATTSTPQENNCLSTPAKSSPTPEQTPETGTASHHQPSVINKGSPVLKSTLNPCTAEFSPGKIQPPSPAAASSSIQPPSPAAASSSLAADTSTSSAELGWKVPTNWAEAPEFVPPTTFLKPKSGSIGGSSKQSGTSNSSGSTAADGQNKNKDEQPSQPKQRSWAQVVNGNIVKQQSVSDAESQLCPFYRVGECRYGNICMYIHGAPCDYCGQNILHPQHDMQRKAHLAECLREHERDMELSFAVARSKEKTCGICMEIVLDKPKGEARFGILPSCTHCFCLPCIRKWRQAKQFEHKIIRACPECRQTSDFICPSRFWVETPEQKDQLLAEYKKNLGLKECKYFNKGSGECPFGNKCFYQHADKDGRIIDVGPPRKPQRRVNAEGNLSLVQRLLLYDFLEEREGQLVLPLDFVELFDLYSDSEDWSENEP